MKVCIKAVDIHISMTPKPPTLGRGFCIAVLNHVKSHQLPFRKVPTVVKSQLFMVFCGYYQLNVGCGLVAWFTLVAKNVQIILDSCNVWKFHYCGKNFWQAIYFPKKMVVWKSNLTVLFPEQKCLFAFPKRFRSRTKPLLKNNFSTNFQGTKPSEGPIHCSRFVA